tara:strand:+ start:369 stop:632 length:264 start_codon:yes stop_codon:yes gene_type:complete
MRKATLLIFIVFMVEAVIHYNLGKKSIRNKKMNLEGIPSDVLEQFEINNPQLVINNFSLPPEKDLIKMAGIVLLFSVISGSLIKVFK